MINVHQDCLYRITLREQGFSLLFGRFAELANLCCRGQKIQNAGAEWFSDALCASALVLGLNPDSREKVTIRFECGGSAVGCMFDSCSPGTLRGIPRNAAAGVGFALHHMDDWETLCGAEGTVVEITRSENGRILSNGKLGSAFLKPSMAMGFFLSAGDNIETEIEVAVSMCRNTDAPVFLADGVLIQALPDCDLEHFAVVRERLHLAEVRQIFTESSDPQVKIGKILKFILQNDEIAAENEIEKLSRIRFACSCSRERILAMAARMLGNEDLKKLLQERAETTMRCHFCGAEYHYTVDDLPDEKSV